MEIQFNWIYISIIGAVIIAVFFGVSLQIQKSSNIDIEGEAVHYLNSILNNAENNVLGEDRIDLQGLGLNVACRDGRSDYSFSGNPVNLETKAVFSPELIRGSMIAKSVFWEAPFKTMPFIALTGSEIAYVIIDDGELGQKVYDLMPDRALKFLVGDPGAFKDENYQAVRFIAFEAMEFPRIKEPKDVSAVILDPTMNRSLFPESYGAVGFRRLDRGVWETEGESFFMDSATVLSALVSDMESYECNMDKAFRKHSIALDIAIGRLGMIDEALAENPQIYTQCSYEKTIEILQDVRIDDIQNLKDLYEARQVLDEHNDFLRRVSCPAIY
jgi:hypothetical protein